ncbi:MAG: hypothetical protein ACRDY0_03780 [Acidimicrobiales bacterium]
MPTARGATLSRTGGLGASPGGLSLSASPGTGGTITFLPSVTGLDSVLAGLGTALLPSLLDAALPQLQTSPISTKVLRFTAAPDLSDLTGNFSGHASTWVQVGQPGWLAGLAGPARAAALAEVEALINGQFVGGGVTATPTAGGVTVAITAGGAGQVSVQAGWNGALPMLALGLTGFAPAGSPVALDGRLGYVNGQLTCGLAVVALSDLRSEICLICHFRRGRASESPAAGWR